MSKPRACTDIKTQHHVRGFLGLAGYYRRFIKYYASIAAPLSCLLQKDGFKWGTVEAAAFDALKHQLSHAPILGLPNFDDTFVVEADTSSKGVPNQVADTLSRMYEEDEGITASFMAMSRPSVGLVNDLKNENETLEELHQLHGKLDREERLDEFRREQGLMLYQVVIISEPRMRKSVDDFIRKCLVCQQTKYSTQATRGLLQPLPTPTAVWEEVSMYFITGLPTFKGLTVIFMVVDWFSKYAHFGTLPTSFNAPKVVELFMEIVVKNHGFPKTIVYDRDPIC
ncbi:ty3-gypsy retrotransposon protein [Tanacetum coccineum]